MDINQDSICKIISDHFSPFEELIEEEITRLLSRVVEVEYLAKHERMLISKGVSTELVRFKSVLGRSLRDLERRANFFHLTAKEKTKIELIKDYLTEIRKLDKQLFSLIPTSKEFRLEETFGINKTDSFYKATLETATKAMTQVLNLRSKIQDPRTDAEIFATAYFLGKDYSVCILTQDNDFFYLANRFNARPFLKRSAV